MLESALSLDKRALGLVLETSAFILEQVINHLNIDKMVQKNTALTLSYLMCPDDVTVAL